MDVFFINGDKDLMVRCQQIIWLRCLQISIKLNARIEWWHSQLEEFQVGDDYGLYN